jgi:hypothetical protein
MSIQQKIRLGAGIAALVAALGPTGAGAQFLPPPNASWAGTTPVQFQNAPDGTPIPAKRIGIVAYCADLYHNAGDTGLQSNKASIDDGGQKRALANLAAGLPADGSGGEGFLGNWFTDGPYSRLGHVGAQNIADMLAYDDGIDRIRDIQVINGSLLLPTATQLIQNFDIVIAYTDNKCGQPIPTAIANSAANALAGFIAVPGKGLLLTGFAFSSSIGFGNAIFANGLSPLTRGGPGLATCTRDAPCMIGSCSGLTAPDGTTCTPQGAPALCKDQSGTFCGQPNYQPLAGPDGDFACGNMLPSVNGPTSSSWATALTPANAARGATLCFNYDNADGTPTNVPFLAINARRNIVAVNGMPADSNDIQKFWYSCLVGNVIQFLSGDRNRCSTPLCR